MKQLPIRDNVPSDEYHDSPGLSQSMLKQIGEDGGPAKVRYGSRKETKPQRFGTLIHNAVLEPKLLEIRYCPTKLTREGTAAWLAEERAQMGKILVKQAEYDEARAIRDAVYRWSDVAKLLLPAGSDGLKTEQSFYWTDPVTGRLCKGRVDAAHWSYNVLLDLKSTEDARFDACRRSCRDYGYDVQDAYYRDGWPLAGGFTPSAFVFLFVEKTKPYLNAAYELERADVDAGRDEIRRLISIYDRCDRLDEWPGYFPGIQSLSLGRNRQ